MSKAISDTLLPLPPLAGEGGDGGETPTPFLPRRRGRKGARPHFRGNDIECPDCIGAEGSKGQRGVALIMVLIFLGVGAFLLAATLNYAGGALKLLNVSRTTVRAQYALDAISQQALWYLQYEDQFQDCLPTAGATPTPQPDGTPDSFVDCVVEYGKWTLATQGKLTGAYNETQVERVNGQEVTVSVEVPGGLTAPPAPIPTPISGACLYPVVTRDPTWVMVGDPVTYTFTVTNCGTQSNTGLRRLKAMLPPTFAYVSGSTTVACESLVAGLWVPNASVCNPVVLDKIPEDGTQGSTCNGVLPDYYPCPQSTPAITDGTKMPNWPDGTSNYAGGSDIRVNPSTDRVVWTFQATPSTWGVFYIESVICYFSSASGDPGPCGSTTAKRSGKVAPVVVGMFNIKGKGQGYAWGASSKLDDAGSDIISQEPQ